MHQLAEKHPASVSRLTYQYRMNNEICRLSSRLIYDGMLKCGTSEVSTQVLDLPRYPEGMPSKASGFCFDWLKSVINPSKPSLFVDTDNIRKHPRPFSQRKSRNEQDGIEELETKAGGKVGGSVVNPTEATLVRYLAMGLVLSGLDPTSIGVISPFRAQVCHSPLICIFFLLFVFNDYRLSAARYHRRRSHHRFTETARSRGEHH